MCRNHQQQICGNLPGLVPNTKHHDEVNHGLNLTRPRSASMSSFSPSLPLVSSSCFSLPLPSASSLSSSQAFLHHDRISESGDPGFGVAKNVALSSSVSTSHSLFLDTEMDDPAILARRMPMRFDGKELPSEKGSDKGSDSRHDDLSDAIIPESLAVLGWPVLRIRQGFDTNENSSNQWWGDEIVRHHCSQRQHPVWPPWCRRLILPSFCIPTLLAAWPMMCVVSSCSAWTSPSSLSCSHFRTEVSCDQWSSF